MTATMTINGAAFHEMLISAANSLENNKEKINDLNVFPVPDGDTGTNMSLTIGSVHELNLPDESLSTCASKAADAVLRSARGNSGAILALFFRGFAKATKDKEDSWLLSMLFCFSSLPLTWMCPVEFANKALRFARVTLYYS